MALTCAGVEVGVASPAGGAVPIDEKSKPSKGDAEDWAPALAALRSTTTLASVQQESFDLIFLPGGHGLLVDMATDTTLQGMLSRQDAVVSSSPRCAMVPLACCTSSAARARLFCKAGA